VARLTQKAPKYVSVPLSQDTYDRLTHRCHYYEINVNEVLVFCINKFIKGDFDKELELPID